MLLSNKMFSVSLLLFENFYDSLAAAVDALGWGWRECEAAQNETS